MQEQNLGCKLQLSNTWMRPFQVQTSPRASPRRLERALHPFETAQFPWPTPRQVLPGRTHPAMSMSACSGYILTGIKVQPRRPNDGWKFVPPVDRKRQGSKRAASNASEDQGHDQPSKRRRREATDPGEQAAPPAGRAAEDTSSAGIAVRQDGVNTECPEAPCSAQDGEPGDVIELGEQGSGDPSSTF